MALGRPSDCNTFDDLGDKFVKAVLASGKDFYRIDVTFDRYRETSIKCATRKKRSPGHAPIRRIIEDGSVPLPKSWSSFVALDDNEADLARFLSEKLLTGAPVEKSSLVVVVDLRRKMQSSVPDRTLTSERLRVSMKRRTLE